MRTLKISRNPAVDLVFQGFPDAVSKKMNALRELVIETAKEVEQITSLEETLKWGEPSYLTNIGSTLRMDWKRKSPNQYAIYFQCTSRLVETFRMLFQNSLEFEGKRAIVLQLEDELPSEELKHCIKATLMYHKVKHLPTLSI